MQTADSPHPFAVSATVSPPPPIPVSALYDISADQLSVTFDQPLQAVPLDGLNWPFRAATRLRVGITGFAFASTVLFTPTTDLGSTFLPPRVSYNASPPDVVSFIGVPADPFTDFLLTVVP